MTLSEFFIGHPVPDYILLTPLEIQTWLDSVPDNTYYTNILNAIDISELGGLFSFRDIPLWINNLCSKIENNTDIEVTFLGANTLERKRQVKILVRTFINDLVNMNLLAVDFQKLISEFILRSSAALTTLLTLLVADGKLTEKTLFNLQVEFSPYKRWQTIGLSQVPTIEEIEAALL